ncbi:hypothetical protein PAXRUDRAFT_156406 [Paxillus rubicundulus Ve08.2h10]|uniref:Unplaced genomic scaffold scaffold_1003, whole genome shotgun sequence n=1 Tax=Paxillus rubicundulus Ve08.2h10 TaxID=930991 RepID=A0A0D0DQ33_9AGAM|nr:hypothetical protein PAXRUDRAFT_156406 [Paxillus rubicundulus Ve08.2h10]
MESGHVPATCALQLSGLIAEHMMDRFKSCLLPDGEGDEVIPSPFIPTRAVCQADWIVQELVLAYQNLGE